MKASEECYPCLRHLAMQASSLAAEDPELRHLIERQCLEFLNHKFSFNAIPAEIANEMHRITRRLSGNKDPYKKFKAREIEISRKFFEAIRDRVGNDLRSRIELAVLGNAIDFFRDLKDVEREFYVDRINFAIDDIAIAEEKLLKANKVLYLADNAGEVFFDIPLLIKLREYAEVIYVVKQSAVQNDLAIEDLRGIDLASEIERVITTGSDTIGIDFSIASGEFKVEFQRADLIFAKGMGYYETLSELPREGRFLFILIAKCLPVARSLGVPLNSCIAMIW
ncbi:MAG: ARMT1-like domain-containing protein [Halobacteria archaeon]